MHNLCILHMLKTPKQRKMGREYIKMLKASPLDGKTVNNLIFCVLLCIVQIFYNEKYYSKI